MICLARRFGNAEAVQAQLHQLDRAVHRNPMPRRDVNGLHIVARAQHHAHSLAIQKERGGRARARCGLFVLSTSSDLAQPMAGLSNNTPR